MRVPTEPATGVGGPARNSLYPWLLWIALGLVAAIAVGVVDWGGIDRSTGSRLMLVVFAFMTAQSLVSARFGRRWGLPREWVVGDLLGAAGAACMVGGELAGGVVSVAFIVAASGFIIANLVIVQRYRREMKAGTRHHGAPHAAASRTEQR